VSDRPDPGRGDGVPVDLLEGGILVVTQADPGAGDG
jgi:hypothetical protein